MKKKFFFILLIILIIIIFYYNYYYEHFYIKVQDAFVFKKIQDALIFKDYQGNLVGTYPDKNKYPQLFNKEDGEYVNMIGTAYGVSEITIPQPKEGVRGINGQQGLRGEKGSEGPPGIDGIKLVNADIESTCFISQNSSDTVQSINCKGPDGVSPIPPPDGTPGECPHVGGKCPNGINGTPGKTCLQLFNHEAGECPQQPHKHGPPGITCEKVNNDSDIEVGPDADGVMRKCPPGAQGQPGRTCEDVNADNGISVFPDDSGLMRKCPVKPNGNNGLSCYEVYKNTLPECSESIPGVNSVDCVNHRSPNVKICGVINPDKPSDVANNLSINGYNGNTLTINNNKEIRFRGNSIKLPTDGNIVLKDANNNIIKTINKSYIDDMILKSQQCNGEYVGIECATRCDPKEGKIPNSSKTDCILIQAHQYIKNGTVKDIEDGYYRNPNDATNIIECQAGYYCIKGIKTKCTGNKYQNKKGQKSCEDCPSCSSTQYSKGSCGDTTNTKTCEDCPSCSSNQYYTGSCGGSTNTKECHNCPSDYYCNGINKYQCSNCGSGTKMIGGCTDNQDTQCSPCTSRTSHKKSAHQQGINWDTSCPHNCKVQIWDNTFRGNDWDVFGSADNGWWIRGSKASGDVYWEGSYNGSGITVSGNELYFWQYTPGNNKWKFNVSRSTSHKKSAHQQGINWDTSCPHNCKVQIWDNTFRGNDWDVYGKADNGWWIRGSKAYGDVYWEGSYNGTGITVSGDELYFWQYTPGNNKWKFNVINNQCYK